MRSCECGCGFAAPVESRNRVDEGVFKGESRRFIRGHHRRRDPVTRFWRDTDKRSDSECWPWRGRIDKAGYGVFYDRFKCINAHRVSYALHYGEIAPRQHVLHKCDNPACVNPNHLSLGSHRDNMVDMARKDRARQKLTIADVKAIRESSELHRVLAARYSVSMSTISRTRSRLRRPHV